MIREKIMTKLELYRYMIEHADRNDYKNTRAHYLKKLLEAQLKEFDYET